MMRMETATPRRLLADEGLRGLCISLLMTTADFPPTEKFCVERFKVSLAVTIIIDIFHIKKTAVMNSRDNMHIFKRNGGDEDKRVANISLLGYSL